MTRPGLIVLTVFAGFTAHAVSRGGELPSGAAPGLSNPILPGYFADPSLVTHDGKYYLYATIDPWGGDTLGCWESADFKEWTYRTLHWPTKQACTSATSKDAMVWAPSVVRGNDKMYYMYVSVGSEIWAGVAAHPLGPWKDANGGKPLVPENFRPGFHMIDAEAFIDEDGQAYLYWGSGWNWVNGKCWVVKLKPDMVTFDGEVFDITPGRFFEAPFMVKRGGCYYLMYSDGKTIEDTYQVHYAVGASPLGPFTEAENSPCLVTDASRNVLSPGHHSVFERDGRHYILYHRHSIPFDPGLIGRQICVDELVFRDDGLIDKVKPTHGGPSFVRRGPGTGEDVVMTSSCQRAPHTTAAMVADDNHATLWAAGKDSSDSWLKMDLGQERTIRRQEFRFEFPTRTYRFVIGHSLDGKDWKVLADHSKEGLTGSPVVIEGEIAARFLRIGFPESGSGKETGIFEWNVR
jgi:arabinoxylan arabinofuranohydrolase